ncbi:hypothetical protein V5799_013280 [Amblyomma americanum]|uniref:Secreted protein n=1 Tax=Amblyomma americanum TaxID=6943 RepID=A0AAQ4E6D6_AMBAM
MKLVRTYVCVLLALVVASECKPASWNPNMRPLLCPRMCLPGQKPGTPCTDGCKCIGSPRRRTDGRLFCYPGFSGR